MDDHPTSMELKSTELTIGGISKVPGASQENPSVDTGQKEASPRSSFTIDKINIGGISTIPGGVLQEKASDDTAKLPQENEPVIDEASPESLSTIVKPVQENPSMEDVESQKENPSVDTDAPSQENPSSAIVEASPGSSSTMVETSEVIKPSSEIAGFGEENPSAMGEEASPESFPEERPSTVVSGRAQETPPATDVASSRSFTMEKRPLEVSPSPISNPEVSEEIPSTEIPETSPENPPVIPKILQENPQETPTVENPEICEHNPPEDSSGSLISNPEVSPDNLSTEIIESLQENPWIDMPGTSTGNPPDGVFPFIIKPACKLKVALEALSNLEFNSAGSEKNDINNAGFGITVLNPSDITGHLRLKASGVQNFQCSKPMGGQLVDVRQISQMLDADAEDTLSVSHTQGSDQISFAYGEEPTKANPATKIAESTLAENPSDDSAEPSSENPSNNDFSSDIKPARKLNLALEALSSTMINPSGTGRIDVNEKGFGVTVLSPSDNFGHLWLKAKGIQNYQCSKSIVADVMQILDNRQVAVVQDDVSVSYTQGSDDISFTLGAEPRRGCPEPMGEASRAVWLFIHHNLPRFPTPLWALLAHSLLTDKVEFLTHLERIRVAFEFLALPNIRSNWNPDDPFSTYIRQYYSGTEEIDIGSMDWDTVTELLTRIHVTLFN